MKLVLSFPIGVLGEISLNELYKQLYSSITQTVKEEDVKGIQIYPAQWPRKILITVKDQTVKQSLLIAGLSINGQHIDLKDDSIETVRITMKDAMIDWGEDKIREILSPFGEIIKVDYEYVYIDRKPTSWKTGTRYIYMTKLNSAIPNRLSTTDGDKLVTVSIWYNRPAHEAASMKCFKCGDIHNAKSCQFTKKVCYICKGDHEVKDCTKNDGSRQNKDVFCFMTEKSPLSNFNMNFPISLNGKHYNCNEQYIQSKKAELFNDWLSQREIMASSDPRQMKQLGKRIRGYNDAEWKQRSNDVIMDCVRCKVYSYRTIQDYLLATGDKCIGEGTPDRHFGVGIHIGDDRILDVEEWTGNNIMGKTLMEIRSEMKMLQSVRNDDVHDESSGSNSVLESTPHHSSPSRPSDKSNEAMSCSPIHNDMTELAPVKTPKCTALLLGDSNGEGLHFDESFFDVQKSCMSGAALQDVTKLMEDKEICPDNVNAVLVQLGTCNWSANQTDNVQTHETVYRDYVEAINSISHKYPYADIVLSSIPKRLPQNQNEAFIKSVNCEIDAVNRLLETLSIDEDNILFVNNDNDLTIAGEPDPNLYVTSDATGVHLNANGLSLISGSLARELFERFNKTHNRSQWQMSKGKKGKID